MNEHEEELQLIAACQRGELAQFGPLYDAYVDKIYRYIYYRVQNKALTEDLVSEIFMKAMTRIGQFKSKKGTFQSWIYRIAHNALIDHYRTRKVHYDIESAWGLSDNTDIEKKADQKALLKEVGKHLASLTDNQREIVLLRLWDDLPYKEIADITGKTENNCKVTYSHAMRNLRDTMPLSALLALILFSNTL